MDPFGAEISDLIVDYDPATLERRDVAKARVLARLRELGVPRTAARVVARLRGEILDRAEIDGVLVRSHLELQRLHEEFNVGAVVRSFLAPMIDVVRRTTGRPIVRVVDLGCGLGYIVRWLAARGELEHVELVGVDYNRALVTAARRLAEAEGLRCTFRVANAFALDEPADLVMSTGVLHHFRGDELRAIFGEHERSQALAFVHVDIRPSRIAPLGAWIFHQSRMREPLARFDGYWSAARAHTGATLREAITSGAPSFALGMIDARPGLAALLQIFQAAVAIRHPHAGELRAAYAPLGRRFEAP